MISPPPQKEVYHRQKVHLLQNNAITLRQTARLRRCFSSRSRDILKDLIHQFPRQGGTFGISVTPHCLSYRVRLNRTLYSQPSKKKNIA